MSRVFLTSVISATMFSEIRAMDTVIYVSTVKEGPEILKDLKFTSVLKEGPIVECLKKRFGIIVEPNPIRITLLPGDVVYVINPGGKTVNLDELPEYSSVTLTKYEVFDRVDFIKRELEKLNK